MPRRVMKRMPLQLLHRSPRLEARRLVSALCINVFLQILMSCIPLLSVYSLELMIQPARGGKGGRGRGGKGKALSKAEKLKAEAAAKAKANKDKKKATEEKKENRY